MTPSGRSFEARGYATRRTHLMPVVGSVHAALTNPLVPNKAKNIGICVAVFATMILGVIL